MSDQLSKYHKESMGSSSGGPQSSSNESTLPQHGGGGSPAVLNPVMIGNPMMPMSGGKAVVGGMGQLDSGNPMVIGGSGGDASLPSMGEVLETNPQGHKAAPLAGKLRSARKSY